MRSSKNGADVSPRRRVSTLYAALGYACIQIRQRGGSSNLSDKFSRGGGRRQGEYSGRGGKGWGLARSL